jgi:hypothetical protein
MHGAKDINYPVERIMDRLLGTQIVYIPTHISRDLQNLTAQKVNELLRNHPDQVEAGFITSVNTNLPGCVFARYWAAGKIGMLLRTAGNSQLTGLEYIVFYKSTGDDCVVRALKEIGYGDNIDYLFDL